MINLVSENSIESRMLETLADKKALAGGVLDRVGDLKEIKLRSGREAMLARLEQVLSASQPAPAVQPARVLPVDRQKGFAEETARMLNGSFVRCEERFPKEAAHSVMYVVVERDAAHCRERLEALHSEYFGQAGSSFAGASRSRRSLDARGPPAADRFRPHRAHHARQSRPASRFPGASAARTLAGAAGGNRVALPAGGAEGEDGIHS